LANGLLTGRYKVDQAEKKIIGSGRLTQSFSTGHVNPFDAVVFRVLRSLALLSQETGYSAAQLALAWLLRQRENSTVLLGVSSTEQLLENLGALDVCMTDEVKAQLDTASTTSCSHPYGFLEDELQETLVTGPHSRSFEVVGDNS
jgi:aryl-alcohol dehydrogenase-like predicted oxidoreductase